MTFLGQLISSLKFLIFQLSYGLKRHMDYLITQTQPTGSDMRRLLQSLHSPSTLLDNLPLVTAGLELLQNVPAQSANSHKALRYDHVLLHQARTICSSNVGNDIIILGYGILFSYSLQCLEMIIDRMSRCFLLVAPFCSHILSFHPCLSLHVLQ